MVTADNVILYRAISLVIYISFLNCWLELEMTYLHRVSCNQIKAGGITDPI